MIARWKGTIEEIHFGGSIMPLTIIENLNLKKPSFRPSKWPRKLKSAKNSKLPKLPENCFESVGKGGWPPISTWITKSQNRSNLTKDLSTWSRANRPPTLTYDSSRVTLIWVVLLRKPRAWLELLRLVVVPWPLVQ
jgi:hypothetical protein